MALQNVSGEDVTKGIAIVVGFFVVLAAGLWYVRNQGYALIMEVSWALVAFIVFAVIYDRVLIR